MAGAGAGRLACLRQRSEHQAGRDRERRRSISVPQPAQETIATLGIVRGQNKAASRWPDRAGSTLGRAAHKPWSP
jgi:hypothetical protein